MPVELTMLSSVTSSPFCLKMPLSSASHSGRLSAIKLLYETCKATGGPLKGAVVAAGAAATAVGFAAMAAAGGVVGAALAAAGGVVGATLAAAGGVVGAA